MHLGLEGVVPASLWLTMFVFFFLSIFKDPAIGLYLLIPLLPLETVRYHLHGYVLGAQFVDVLLLGVIIGLKRRGLRIIPETPLNALLFAYIVFTYLSMVWGSFSLDADLPLWFSDRRVSDWKNVVVDLSLMFFVSASALRTKRHMKILIFCMCLGMLLVAKNFHSAIADRDFSSFSYSLRDAGTMGGAGINGLAAFTAQVSIFVLGLSLAERKWRAKLGYLLVFIAGTYCVLFALSRGAYAALLVGLVFLGAVRSRMLLVAVFGFLLVWQSIVPQAVKERVFMTTDENGEVEHSAAARISLLDEALETFRSDPVFGTGFNTYAYRSHVGGYQDSHDLYVKWLVETGVPGLLLFLTILFSFFRIGFRLYRTAGDPFFRSLGLGFAGLILAAIVANMFGDRWMYFQITGYTFVIAAMVARGQQITAEADGSESTARQPELGTLAVA